MQGLLFQDPGPAIVPSFKVTLARDLARLAVDDVRFGISSWKYRGWVGSIYTRDRYLTRGRFSEKRFNETCLAEYAEVFPIVCGDFSFYQFPSEAFWRNLFQTSPPNLEFAFKVPEFITVRLFPNLPRWGDQGGRSNETFLDYRLFETQFLELLRPYRNRIRCLMLEFSPMPSGLFADDLEFVDRLDKFLRQLSDEFRFAVEIRNPEFFSDAYLDLLRQRKVAHVLNAWTRMPTIGEQWKRPGIVTTDFVVARALLRQGRLYEEAVRLFEPYAEVREVQPETRESLFEIARRQRLVKQAALLFVNNRLEGNAPGTIAGVIEMGL